MDHGHHRQVAQAHVPLSMTGTKIMTEGAHPLTNRMAFTTLDRMFVRAWSGTNDFHVGHLWILFALGMASEAGLFLFFHLPNI